MAKKIKRGKIKISLNTVLMPKDFNRLEQLMFLKVKEYAQDYIPEDNILASEAYEMLPETISLTYKWSDIFSTVANQKRSILSYFKTEYSPLLMYFQDDKGIWHFSTIIKEVLLDDVNKKVTLNIDKGVVKVLIDFRSGFRLIEACVEAGLSKAETMNLYELISEQRAPFERPIYGHGGLKEMLGICEINSEGKVIKDKLANISLFGERVLDKAKEEMEKSDKCPMSFDWKFGRLEDDSHANGRKIEYVSFYPFFKSERQILIPATDIRDGVLALGITERDYKKHFYTWNVFQQCFNPEERRTIFKALETLMTSGKRRISYLVGALRGKIDDRRIEMGLAKIDWKAKPDVVGVISEIDHAKTVNGITKVAKPVQTAAQQVSVVQPQEESNFIPGAGEKEWSDICAKILASHPEHKEIIDNITHRGMENGYICLGIQKRDIHTQEKFNEVLSAWKPFFEQVMGKKYSIGPFLRWGLI